MKTLFQLALLLISLLAHSSHASVCPLPYKPVTSKAQAIEVAKAAIEAYQLSSLKPECLQFFAEEPSKGKAHFGVEIREKHDAICGGDPNTSPRVVSLQVQHGGQILSDADNAEGVFNMPRCPLVRPTNKAKL
jgi:hypothetical protein